MNEKKSYFRNDIVLFSLLLVFILAVLVVVLLYAPTRGSFNLFLPFCALIFIMIFTYALGLQKGLILSIVATFVYGSYVVYHSSILNDIPEADFSYIAWMLFFPLSSIIAGQLSGVISQYKHELDSKQNIEKLVAIDANTGFYKEQEFFKNLEEEFARSRRYKAVFSLIVIQISNFSELQIVYGEIDAINILKAVADRIEDEMRITDGKFLIGTDTLGIVLPETDLEGAKVVVEKLHLSLDRVTTTIRGDIKKVVRIKPNIGTATYNQNDSDSLEVYDRALEDLNYDKG